MWGARVDLVEKQRACPAHGDTVSMSFVRVRTIPKGGCPLRQTHNINPGWLNDCLIPRWGASPLFRGSFTFWGGDIPKKSRKVPLSRIERKLSSLLKQPPSPPHFQTSNGIAWDLANADLRAMAVCTRWPPARGEELGL